MHAVASVNARCMSLAAACMSVLFNVDICMHMYGRVKQYTTHEITAVGNVLGTCTTSIIDMCKGSFICAKA